MTTDPDRELANLRERLKNGERGGSERDRTALLDFEDTLALRQTEYGAYRRLKLLRHCTRMSEHVDVELVDTLQETEPAEEIVRWIHREYDNPETNRDYRVALRQFARHGTDGDEVPDTVAWVSGQTESSYNPTADPAEMLEWETDVEPMIEECRNARDRALIALQFDAGLRGGELYELDRSDLSDHERGLRVRVDGKTGQRSVTLIPSVPHVQAWLREHPGGATDPLWSKLSNPARLSYQGMLRIFKVVGRRAEIEKPTTPTNFRKSNATWLAKRGANAAMIEDRQGRKRGSDAVARYVASFAEDEASQYAALHGMPVEETEPADMAPVDCPRCERPNPPTASSCGWCSQALSPEATAEAESLDMAFMQSLAEADDDVTVEDLLSAREELTDAPALRRLLLDG